MKIACKVRDEYSNLKNISGKTSHIAAKHQDVTGPLAITEGRKSLHINIEKFAYF